MTREEALEKLNTSKAMVELNKVANKYGYKVQITKANRKCNYTNCNVGVDWQSDEREYFPDIYYDGWHYSDKAEHKRFGVNMGGYGTKYDEELDRWFAHQKAGYECAKELTEVYKTLTEDDFFYSDEIEIEE